ncbi:hypothetical protein SAMN06265337_2316 [Hymenobacter gelipurpurascens]|uniref:Uncharacterized protein n=1 Tax=Hymenobacter gelipurpurascens TaxID=89968 RepID=A0A212TRF1_9BACT|nr:hypothetical protein [Hymenobacter gelipurpurascens]SNC68441.1 hypothetical protein SAMN06265337_2316 [Hymenobacter gelipurpurascens]
MDASITQRGSLVKVEVKAVDFLITSFNAINCQNFSQQFPEASVLVINKTSDLLAISQEINLLKSDASTTAMNTRAQVTLHYLDGHTSTLCLSKFGMQQDGQNVTNNTKLRTLLGLTFP